MNLDRKTFHFRIETPLFLSGFHTQNVELRVPSIKGVLRYWYRAIQPDLTWDKSIFGSTKSQSQIQLHISKQRLWKRVERGEIPSYIAFSLRKKDHHQRIIRRAYLSGTFSLEVLMHPQRKQMDKQVQWRDLWASLWLMTTIGGLGNRSRRGLGTIQWMNSKESPLPAMRFAKTPEEWVEQFRQGVHQLWEWYPPQPLSKVSYLMVKPSMKIFRCKVQSSRWSQAFRKAANALQNFRKNHQDSPRISEIFGTSERRQRLPSSVWLRIVRIQDKYIPIFFFLKTDQHPKSELFVERWGRFVSEQDFEMEAIET